MDHIDSLFTQFEDLCETVGSEASPQQVERLLSWAVVNFGRDHYEALAEIALDFGIGPLFTDLRMHASGG